MKEHLTKQNALIFLVGATASCVLKSKRFRSLLVSATAEGMRLRNNAEHTLAGIKEEAEDIYAQAQEEARKADK